VCQELKDELAAGQEAARAVVEHVLRMGAGNAEIPVEDWLVIVKPKDGEFKHGKDADEPR
jgi:hypothetical protein